MSNIDGYTPCEMGSIWQNTSSDTYGVDKDDISIFIPRGPACGGEINAHISSACNSIKTTLKSWELPNIFGGNKLF